ncbi:hypothetical protein [Salinarimonas chemoclinalis]|uniref:hypothetical protein n=1 Tax=Salinarimonas chemoclinalis TaxID=3241599 RepID=UPI0035574657
MFVVLYVVAAAMIVGGAFAVLTGWEILLLERGWSMVIAGATLATGGLVLGGVAAAARALATRIDSLADAVRASRNAASPAFPRRPGTPGGDAAEGLGAAPEPVAPTPAREIAPKLPPQDPTAPAGPAPAVALGIGGVAAGAIAPSLETARPEPEAGLPPLDLGPIGEPSATEPDEEASGDLPIEPRIADAPPAVGAEDGQDTRSEPAPEPLGDEPREEPEAAPEEEFEQEPHEEPDVAPLPVAGIEEPVLAPREPSRIAAEAEALTRRHEASAPSLPPDAEAPELEVTPQDETAPTPTVALDEASHGGEEDAVPADAPHADEAEIGETPAEAGAEPPEPPHVVGTHVSGANRYVMYSDGSIEAETPDGRLVFGSIEELKGYVASNGEDPSGASRTGPG